ncbi:hypothetical protein HGM15179_006556 [Zosterops borbonicus]|uniref:Uncharacterized protein n=1 Tax=Zosterops borbonicus TaxID=364589 RepID=A0A8K1GMZ2_9PASS|nr:hypothetical protein HGM15179_006556 [Zosterops borbonicus]
MYLVTFHQILSRALSNGTLNDSRDGISTTSLENPCQSFTIPRIIHKDFKQDCLQFQALWNTTSDQSPVECHITHHSLGLAIQPIFIQQTVYPSSHEQPPDPHSPLTIAVAKGPMSHVLASPGTRAAVKNIAQDLSLGPESRDESVIPAKLRRGAEELKVVPELAG